MKNACVNSTVGGATVVEALCCEPEFRRFASRWEHCDFSVTSFFRPKCGPGVDSVSNRNEYQSYLLWCKSGRCVARQPCDFHQPIVLPQTGIWSAYRPAIASHGVYSWVFRLRGVSWAWCVARVREMKTTTSIIMINPQVKKQFGRPRSRWKKLLKWMNIFTI
jgi:hypothetical protein